MRNVHMYRQSLIENGFTEASANANHFFKALMPDVAFVVNLSHNDAWGCCTVTYGCASTAFTKMANNRSALTTYGVNSSEITIRDYCVIAEGESTAQIENEIRNMYIRFAKTDKDTLLQAASDLRKTFISKFSVPLKPLGLRKKGNVWALPSGRRIFDIQKSMYSDRYYFNLYADLKCPNVYPGAKRLIIPGYAEPYDWQLLSEKVLDDFIENCVVKSIVQLLASNGCT